MTVVDPAADPVAAHRAEEFKALRREIEYLDQRIERSQYTMLLVNAVALTAIYVPVRIKNPVFELETSETTIASLGLTVSLGLLSLNAVTAAKYIYQGRHIDTIGDYLARLEDAIYGDEHPRLGWERMMRTPGGLARGASTIKGRRAEHFRRYGIWILLFVASLAAVVHKGLVPWLAKGAL